VTSKVLRRERGKHKRRKKPEGLGGEGGVGRLHISAGGATKSKADKTSTGVGRGKKIGVKEKREKGLHLGEAQSACAPSQLGIISKEKK